jgi:hypothetical protein
VRQEEWQRRATEHAERVRPWVDARLARRAAGRKHAVDDFLFDYYPFSPAKLSAWHPGYGVVLEGPEARSYLAHPSYIEASDGVTADPSRLASKRPRLNLAIRILSGTKSRPAMTGCFGLHEWAMVYGLTQGEVRHAYLPLRVTPSAIVRTVDEVGLRCTHIDAYRFFTPEAMPLNPTAPTRETQPEMEQPGCLHAGMDLYKYAFWFSPFVSSELVTDCFELARTARQVDMAASPYDCGDLGLDPIRVESAEGRQHYAAAQKELMDQSAPLRARLEAVLVELRVSSEEISEASDPSGRR